MTSRPRRRFWLKIAAGLLFAVVAYFGAYYAMMEPRYPAAGQRDPRHRHIFARPRYVVNDMLIRRFFVPAHLCDRVLRPDVWGPTLEELLREMDERDRRRHQSGK